MKKSYGEWIILCPSCLIRIPLFKVQYGDMKIKLVFQCSCIKERKSMLLSEYKSLYAEKFNCELGGIDLSEMKDDDYEHDINMIGYNYEFDHTCTSECMKEYGHYDYGLIRSLDYKAMYNETIAKIDARIKQDTETIKLFLNMTHKNEAMVSSIMKAYDDYQSINNQLKELNEALYFTAKTIEYISLFQLKYMFNLLNVNKAYSISKDYYQKEQEGEQLTRIELLYNDLLGYFRNNLIFKVERYEIALMSVKHWEGRSDIRLIVELSKDLLLSIHNNCTFTIWDIKSGQYVTRINYASNYNYSGVALLSNGLLVLPSHFKYIEVWDVKTWEGFVITHKHKKIIFSIIELHNGLLASCSDNTIALFHVPTFQCITQLEGHKKLVMCLIQLTNGLLVSSSTDLTMKIWNIDTLETLNTVGSGEYSALSMIELKNGFLATCSNNDLRLWDMDGFKCVSVVKGYSTNYYCFKEVSNGLLILRNNDAVYILFDLSTKSVVASIDGYYELLEQIIQLNTGAILIIGTHYLLHLKQC